MTYLLRTPAPHPTESLLGHVLRLSEENCYDSPWHVLVQAGIHQGEMTSPGFPINKLASVTGQRVSVYEAIAYRTPGTSTGYRLLGHHLGDALSCRPLRLRRPAICTCCIEESKFVDAFWDLSIAVACPRHGTRATLACPACGQVLSWFRPGLLQCKCGADLRAASPSAASAAVIELMDIVRATLYGHEQYSPRPTTMAADALARLSLRELIALIRQLGSFALFAATGDSMGSEEAIVQAAAESLARWPHGFHSLLRRLANLPGAKVDSPSFVVRLSGFYSAVLKRRKEHEFLREEFIRFGAQAWGGGLVDARMLPAGVDRRYTSLTDLSRRLGLDRRTLSRWAANGSLSVKEVEVGRGTRYVVDASGLPENSVAPGCIVEARRAAQLVELPVAVLRALKGSKYMAAHSPAAKRGYHSADLEALRVTLSNRAAATCPLPAGVPANATITLGAVMKNARFGGARDKAGFLGSYLAGDVAAFQVKNDGQTEVVFLRSTVNDHARASRALGMGISRTDAGKMLACGATGVDELIRRGYIHSSLESSRRVAKASVDAFLEHYVPMSRMADELRTRVGVLLGLSRALGKTVLLIPDSRGGHTAFVSHELACSLREARSLHQRVKRAAPVERLRRYLEELARSGKALPRKGSFPNKAEIARACGFDRGQFHRDAAVRELLQCAAHEDGLRLKLPTPASPTLRLERYLQELRVSGQPLPRRSGWPNRAQIARACGISRSLLYASPELLQLLDTHANAL